MVRRTGSITNVSDLRIKSDSEKLRERQSTAIMMRSSEKPTTEPEGRPEPGTSKGTTQKIKTELIKTRAPLRRTVTLLHVKLRELISGTFLKERWRKWN